MTNTAKNSSSNHMINGRRRLNEGQLCSRVSAVRIENQIPSSDSSMPFYFYKRGQVNTGMGSFKRPELSYLRALKSETTRDSGTAQARVQAYLSLAAAYAHQGQLDPAIRAYRSIVAFLETKGDPESFDALNQAYDCLIVILCDKENYKMAMTWAWRAKRFFEEHRRLDHNLIAHQFLRLAFISAEMSLFNDAEEFYWKAFYIKRPELTGRDLNELWQQGH